MASSADRNESRADSMVMLRCCVYFVSVFRYSDNHNNGDAHAQSAANAASASGENSPLMVRCAMILASTTIICGLHA